MRTIVLFTTEGAGSRMTVEQSYEIDDPGFRFAVEGAAEGWRTTLDKLEREVARSAPAVRGAFSLERTFKATPAQAFKAFADDRQEPLVRRRRDHDDRAQHGRAAGWARGRGRPMEERLTTRFDAFYFDVVPDRRLVYAYEMHLDRARFPFRSPASRSSRIPAA